MKKLLVTGAGGYIGSIATYLLLQNGYDVIAVDNLSTGYKEPLELLQQKFGKEHLRLYIQDLREPIHNIFEAEKNISGVIHYAAPCNVDESMKEPRKYFDTITIGLNVIDTMLLHNVNNLVFSSTCAVYGETEHVPVDENHPTLPVNPYGESKKMVENIIQWYSKLKNLHFMILRYFNVCGASDDGLIGDSKKPSRHLVQNAVRGALGIEQFFLTCPHVDTPDKTPIRDYVNVVDLNEAHIKALEHLFAGGKSDIINIGTGTGDSVLSIVNKVEEITGKSIKTETTETRAGEYAQIYADISKAQSILKWVPKRSIKDSVRALVAWYNQYPQGWNG